jgi:hypothetical protein
MLVDVGDTRLHVEERGAGDLALIALHGGPGLDHSVQMAFVEEPGASRAAVRRFLARV